MNKPLIFDNWTELKQQISLWHQENKSVVFTNGCFDLIHIGHLRLLNEARKQGDVLIVALNTDESIQRLKGTKRPILPQLQRAQILAALECVDAVTFFAEDTPEEILRDIRPDVLVKGGDYRFEEIVGHDFIPEYGGKVLPSIMVEGYSTTRIIEKILNVYDKSI